MIRADLLLNADGLLREVLNSLWDPSRAYDHPLRDAEKALHSAQFAIEMARRIISESAGG